MTAAPEPVPPVPVLLNRVAGPFVLLDDARSTDAADARLFMAPVETLSVTSPDAVLPALATLDRWLAGGSHVAGYLAYEAGHALEPRLAPLAQPLPDGWPLLWFGRFGAPRRIAPDAVPALLPDAAGAAVSRPDPRITAAGHAQAVAAILSAIRAGDIYQANLTFNATVRCFGHPLAVYHRLRGHARAGYGGVVFTGTHWLLSLSPELFFSLRGGQMMARPMKGTAERGATPAADAALASNLASDPKQRAENLMIVDLLRNDLSRVAEPGSVAVPALFRVETYPTVHQMVSDVTARIAPATPLSRILSALYPCGSITGAPKIRAMEIIAATEQAPRGAYTGSIGFAAPDGDAAFNVAIRTLALADAPLSGGVRSATLGLGSGIVADSLAGAEWQECLAKGGYVVAAHAAFDLLETMRFDPDEGVALLDRHIARIGDSARALGFVFDRHAARNMLQQATFRLDTAARVRLRLGRSGVMAVETSPPPVPPASPLRLAVVPLPVAVDDVRLRHKSSDRAFYDDARRVSGADEVLFVAPDGSLTEGSFTSLFLERGGVLLTPPADGPLLPGVLRAELLAQGRAREARLTPADLDQGTIWVGNALRGLMRAQKY